MTNQIGKIPWATKALTLDPETVNHGDSTLANKLVQMKHTKNMYLLFFFFFFFLAGRVWH